MRIIVCLDENGGMLFNHRRQSRDRIVVADIAKYAKERNLYTNTFSASLFDEIPNITVSDSFLEEASEYDYCFVENISLKQYQNLIKQIIVYHWNRTYPSDFKFDIDLNNGAWKCTEITEFKGYSHEKITKEVYEK